MRHFVGVLIAVLILTATASAEPIIGFTGAGGMLSWGGGDTALSGMQINILASQGIGTSDNAGLHLVTSGRLKFTTGSFAGTMTGAAGQTILAFNPGGTFSLTGGLPDGPIPTGTVLLSGQFTGITTFDPILGIFAATTGSGITSNLSPALLAYYGMASAPLPFEFTATIVSGLPQSLTSGFTSSAYVTQITSSSQLSNSPVPEPASIVLLSLVLLGCSTIVRQRLKRARNSSVSPAVETDGSQF